MTLNEILTEVNEEAVAGHEASQSVCDPLFSAIATSPAQKPDFKLISETIEYLTERISREGLCKEEKIILAAWNSTKSGELLCGSTQQEELVKIASSCIGKYESLKVKDKITGTIASVVQRHLKI